MAGKLLHLLLVTSALQVPACKSAGRHNGPDPFVTNGFIDDGRIWLSASAETGLAADSRRRQAIVYQVRGKSAARLALKASFLEICNSEAERGGLVAATDTQGMAAEEKRQLYKLELVKEILQSDALRYTCELEHGTAHPVRCTASLLFTKPGLRRFCTDNQYPE